MTLVNRIRRFLALAAASAVLATAAPAFAQDVTEAHLKAARAAVAAIQATDIFDSILPASAAALKKALIEKNPDLQQLIIETVDQKTFELAARRADLEKEAATSYAKVFSEEDLNAIAAFYTSATGKKLLSDGPIVSRELEKAAEIWQRGISRDLGEAVGKILGEHALKTAPAQPAAGDAPAQPAAN